MRLLPALAVAFAACAGSASAITVYDSDSPDPFRRGATCETPELMSYGSYVYDAPSKYDLIFLPTSRVWECPTSGYVSFSTDFQNLTPSEKGKIAQLLKTKGRKPLAGLDGVALARHMEEIYALRDIDDDARAHLMRYMAWQLQAKPEAESYRHKAFDLHKQMLDSGQLAGFPLQETLFILGHYAFRFGDRKGAEAYFEQIKSVEVTDEYTGDTAKGSEYLEGLAADVVAGRADDAVRFKHDAP